MRFSTFVTIFLSLAAATSVCAEVNLSKKPFNEEFQAKTRVSGSIITGFVSFGDSVSSKSLTIAGYIPKEWAGVSICLNVVTLNGFYEAKNEYFVDPNWQGGPESFEYPTEYEGVLSSSDKNAISFKIQKGSCQSPTSELTLSFWNGFDDSDPSVLVNSFGADAVYAYVGDNLQPETCDEVNLPGASAFDTVCRLPMHTGKGTISVEILRVVNAKPAPSETVTIWLP